MEYVYAGLILDEVGTEITKQTLTRTLKSAGVDVESSRVKSLVRALEDVDIQEVTDSVDGEGPDEYVYTGLLLDEVGTEITKQTLTRTLKSAGVDVESSRVSSGIGRCRYSRSD